MTEVMRVCFRHRYPELLAKGLVDESTRIIDKEDLDFYTSKNLPYKQIKKGLGLEPDDIKRLRELERSLLASDRDRALDGIASEASDDATDDVPEGDDGTYRTDRAAIFMYADDNGSASLHVSLATRLCREMCVESCPAIIGGSIDPSGIGHDIRSAIGPIHSMDVTMLLIWTDQCIPDDDLRWLRSYCEGRRIRIIPIGDMPSLWKGIIWGDNDIKPKGGRWMELRWAHIPETASGVSRSTRVLNIEDAMDCARLGIPYWAVAESIGVSRMGMKKALCAEGIYDDCMDAYWNARNVTVASETPVCTPSETPMSESRFEVTDEEVSPVNSEGGAQITEVSELQPPMRAPSDTPSDTPISEFRPEVTDEVVSPVNSEGGAQIAEVSELQPPIDTPSEKAPETPSEDVHRDTPRKAPSEVPAIIEMGFAMMTVSGAKGVVSTINDGTAPDEDLWTPVADGFTVDTYRLSLIARDGRVYYCVGVACEVIKAVYTPAKETVYFDRQGRVYALDGCLTLRLADWSAVEVPIVSDVPVNTKRWIA